MNFVDTTGLQRVRYCPKCGNEMFRDPTSDDGKVYYDIWWCQDCGHEEKVKK
jgi:DNA-directed RNA polymerase subunit M/transcription elongation factor TFIIS